MPFGTLLADDAIWQFWMHGTGPARRHMLQGGQDSLPWKQRLNPKDRPAFKRGLRQRPRLEEPDRGRRQLPKVWHTIGVIGLELTAATVLELWRRSVGDPAPAASLHGLRTERPLRVVGGDLVVHGEESPCPHRRC